MNEYFSERKSLVRRVKPQLDLSNYATKEDIKNAIFAKKFDLADLKSDADKLDIDKLKNVTTNLSNL